jgi:hypothetical protein
VVTRPSTPLTLSNHHVQKAPPEDLFRSLSLVVADNARTEYAFIQAFFGRPDDFYHPVTTEKINVTFAQKLNRERPTLESAQSHLSTIPDDETGSVISDSQASSHPGSHLRPRVARSSRSATEHVWKQIFEPSLEYAKVSPSIQQLRPCNTDE